MPVLEYEAASRKRRSFNTADKTISRAGHFDESTSERLEVLSLIDALRSGERASVEIFCDDPDVVPTCMIEVAGRWTRFQRREFRGETVLACLRAAKFEMDEARTLA